MSAQRLFDMVKNVSGIIKDLEDAGMRVELGDDFSKYRLYRSSQTDRSPMYPMFDVASSYIDGSNGFWICGFNEANELIHTQAVRLLDLSDVSLGQHLSTHRLKYITPDTTPDPDQTFYSGPDALRSITGKVCYHGEFWLPGRGLGGPRSQGVTPLLSRILFEMMYGNWEPDYVFALVPKRLAARGAHLRYGYNHCEPGRWLGPDQQVTEEDHLIWMSTDEMRKALREEPLSLRNSDQLSAVGSTLASVDSKA